MAALGRLRWGQGWCGSAATWASKACDGDCRHPGQRRLTSSAGVSHIVLRAGVSHVTLSTDVSHITLSTGFFYFLQSGSLQGRICRVTLCSAEASRLPGRLPASDKQSLSMSILWRNTLLLVRPALGSERVSPAGWAAEGAQSQLLGAAPRAAGAWSDGRSLSTCVLPKRKKIFRMYAENRDRLWAAG